MAPGLFADLAADGWGDGRLQTLVIDVTIVMPRPGHPGKAAEAAERKERLAAKKGTAPPTDGPASPTSSSSSSDRNSEDPTGTEAPELQAA